MPKTLLKAFIKYGIVGCFATTAHYLIFIILIKFAFWLPWKATFAGATVGAFIAYLLNYKFTFMSRSRHLTLLPRFLCVALLGVIIQTSFMMIFSGYLHYFFLQLIATTLALGLTFVLNRFWTFV